MAFHEPIFSLLHPKHCILERFGGVYAVCACVIHQNITLMMRRSTTCSLFQLTKKPEKKACFVETESHALTQCASYRGSHVACNLLTITHNFEFGDEITHRQWAMGDLSALMNDVPCEEFTDDLTSNIWTTFHSHSFVARHSVEVLTQCTESLNDHEYIVLLGFTQNSSFTAPEAVQVYHWSMVKQHFVLQ
jgi:hypothetical protein